MKKIIIFAVAVATLFAFSSCQKENLQDNGATNGVRIITATFENATTKTTLNSDGKTPEWEPGDVIRILSETSYQDVTLAAGDIADNKITFTTSLEGTLYAVYPASATSLEKCEDGKVTFTIPAIQDGTFASANICVAISTEDDEYNKDNLIFRNATAVLKITTADDVVGVDVTASNCIAGEVTATFSGTAVSLSTSSLDRHYVSAVGTSAPTDNVFYLAAAPVTTGDATVNCYSSSKKGTEGKSSKSLSRNVIYAMDLTSVEPSISDITGQHGILEGHEYVVIKCGENNLKWATMNIGATTITGATSYGKLYSWGNIEGQSGDSFDPAFGESNYNSTEGKKVNDTDYPWDKTKHDAAYCEWGPSWRMPTGGDSGEFAALINATYAAWDATDKGYYVYIPQAGDAGKQDSSKQSDYTYDKSNALLFFPAAGWCEGDIRDDSGTLGEYWSSTLEDKSSAWHLVINGNTPLIDNDAYDRYGGLSIRPVSE